MVAKNGAEFITYKHLIVQKLIESQEVLDLLTDQIGYNIETADELINNQIMDYCFVPNVDNDSKSYITLSTKIAEINNNTILKIQTSIYVIVPYNKVKLSSSFKRVGNRIDELVFEIISLLNTTRTFGIGKIQLLPNTPFTPAEKHAGFEVRFLTTDFNG